MRKDLTKINIINVLYIFVQLKVVLPHSGFGDNLCSVHNLLYGLRCIEVDFRLQESRTSAYASIIEGTLNR